MTILRIILAGILFVMAAYTLPVILNHGVDIVPIFFADLMRLDWTGQFILDFSMFLGLAALWIAWRRGFGLTGLALALGTIFGGMAFFATYLLLQTYRVRDVEELLTGKHR